jgi:hypothetical protein
MMTLNEFHEDAAGVNSEDESVALTDSQNESKRANPSAVSIPPAKRLPAITNLSRSILNRNRMGAVANIQKQVQKFKEVSKAQQIEKHAWISTSQKMSDLYSELKEKLNTERQTMLKSVTKQKSKHEATRFDEIGDSDLVRDALETSLSCIDRMPIMDSIQESYDKIKQVKEDMENCGLLANLQQLIQNKDENIKMNSISEDLIFKDLLDVQKEELKLRILANPAENKKAIAIENLIDQANRQTSDVIHMLEKDRKALDLDDLRDSIKQTKMVHQERLAEIRRFNQELEQKLDIK